VRIDTTIAERLHQQQVTQIASTLKRTGRACVDSRLIEIEPGSQNKSVHHRNRVGIDAQARKNRSAGRNPLRHEAAVKLHEPVRPEDAWLAFAAPARLMQPHELVEDRAASICRGDLESNSGTGCIPKQPSCPLPRTRGE